MLDADEGYIVNMNRNKKDNNKEEQYSEEEQEIIFDRAKELSHELEELGSKGDKKDKAVTMYIALELVQERIRKFARERLGEINGADYIDRMDRVIRARLDRTLA